MATIIGIQHAKARMTGTSNYRIVELHEDGETIRAYLSEAVYLFYEDALEDAVAMGASEEPPTVDVADD